MMERMRTTRRSAAAVLANAQDGSKWMCGLAGAYLCWYIYSILETAGHIYIAKERYDAIGNRSNRVLSFERGEELEVFNPLSTTEWWEVYRRGLYYDLVFHR